MIRQMIRQNAPEEQSSGVKEIYDWLEALLFALITVILLFTFVFRIIGVEGVSMQKTLFENDRVIISNLTYEPTPGDIVVLNKPNFTGKPFIKRVIATEGQTVDIDYEKGCYVVDGVELNEPYVNELIEKVGDVSMPMVVPDGQIFVSGDNRNHSTDSRSTLIGTVDERYIMGKAYVRIFPFNKITWFANGLN